MREKRAVRTACPLGMVAIAISAFMDVECCAFLREGTTSHVRYEKEESPPVLIELERVDGPACRYSSIKVGRPVHESPHTNWRPN